MLKNFGNKLQGGQPRSLVVVRPATVGGFISGAKELIINHARLIAPKIIYILALIVGVVVGLSQVGFVRVVARTPSSLKPLSNKFHMR
jgi:hypothetical protein